MRWDASGVSHYTGVSEMSEPAEGTGFISNVSSDWQRLTECCLEEDLRLHSHQAGKAVSVRTCGDKGGGSNCARHLPSLAQTVVKIIFPKKGGFVGNLSLRQHGEEGETCREQTKLSSDISLRPPPRPSSLPSNPPPQPHLQHPSSSLFPH